jgi:hypothetical protein
VFSSNQLRKAKGTSEFGIVLPGPKLAGQIRVSIEEITGEVSFGKLSLDEIDDIVVHEKLVKRVRIFHVGAIEGGDVRRWITGIGIVFQECSKNSEPLCSGLWCANFAARNIPNKEAAPVCVITAVQQFDIVRFRYTANFVVDKIGVSKGKGWWLQLLCGMQFEGIGIAIIVGIFAVRKCFESKNGVKCIDSQSRVS